jgi:hypothetical protein
MAAAARRREDLFGSRPGVVTIGGGLRGDTGGDIEGGEDDVFVRKKRLEEAQDEHLDAIGATLQRVGQMAEGFGNELRSQNDLLDQVGVDMDRTNNAMRMVEGKTAELVKQAGGKGYFCIIVGLGTVAFVLFLMIIYT